MPWDSRRSVFSPHLCVRGQVPVGLALGSADLGRSGGRILGRVHLLC